MSFRRAPRAIIAVNYGSNPANNAGGDTNVAAAWVGYVKTNYTGKVKYWEIGNEIGGNGYYGTNLDWEYDLHYPETNAATRVGQPALSPAAYGTNAIQFISAMKAQDNTIKCGVGFDTGNSTYNSQLLGVCGSVADFVIIHWYPQRTHRQHTGRVNHDCSNHHQSTMTQLTNVVGATKASQMKIARHRNRRGYRHRAPRVAFCRGQLFDLARKWHRHRGLLVSSHRYSSEQPDAGPCLLWRDDGSFARQCRRHISQQPRPR